MNLAILTKLFSFLAPKMQTVLEDIGDVVEAVGTWLINVINLLVPLFYNSTAKELTFIGWLTVIGFGVGMVLMILRIVRSYTRVGR